MSHRVFWLGAALAVVAASLIAAAVTFGSSAGSDVITPRQLVQPGALVGQGPEGLAWSPAGARLVYVDAGDTGDVLWLYDAEAGKQAGALRSRDRPRRDRRQLRAVVAGRPAPAARRPDLALGADRRVRRALAQGAGRGARRLRRHVVHADRQGGLLHALARPLPGAAGRRRRAAPHQRRHAVHLQRLPRLGLQRGAGHALRPARLRLVARRPAPLLHAAGRPQGRPRPDHRLLDRPRLRHVDPLPHRRARPTRPSPCTSSAPAAEGRRATIPLPEDTEYVLPFFTWTNDSTEAYFITVDRDHTVLRLCAYTPSSGRTRTVIKETSERLHQRGLLLRARVPAGRQAVPLALGARRLHAPLPVLAHERAGAAAHAGRLAHRHDSVRHPDGRAAGLRGPGRARGPTSTRRSRARWSGSSTASTSGPGSSQQLTRRPRLPRAGALRRRALPRRPVLGHRHAAGDVHPGRDRRPRGAAGRLRRPVARPAGGAARVRHRRGGRRHAALLPDGQARGLRPGEEVPGRRALVRRPRPAARLEPLRHDQHLQHHRARHALHAGRLHRLAPRQPRRLRPRPRLRGADLRRAGPGGAPGPARRRRLPQDAALRGRDAHRHRRQVLRRLHDAVRPAARTGRLPLRRGRLGAHRLVLVRHHLHRALHAHAGGEPGRLRGDRTWSTSPTSCRPRRSSSAARPTPTSTCRTR